MAFDFHHSSRARAISVHVTIQKSGVICISSAAVDKFAIADWDRAVLGYERETNRIAIRECSEGLRLSPQGGGSCRVISAPGFLSQCNILHEKKCRFRTTFEDGMVIIHLNEEPTI